jgi:hypothetical protein
MSSEAQSEREAALALCDCPGTVGIMYSLEVLGFVEYGGPSVVWSVSAFGDRYGVAVPPIFGTPEQNGFGLDQMVPLVVDLPGEWRSARRCFLASHDAFPWS